MHALGSNHALYDTPPETRELEKASVAQGAAGYRPSLQRAEYHVVVWLMPVVRLRSKRR